MEVTREVEIARRLIKEIRFKNEHLIPILPNDKADYIVMIDSLDKRVPKKPLDYDDTERFFIKCTCGKVMDTRFFGKYCTYCGQHLET